MRTYAADRSWWQAVRLATQLNPNRYGDAYGLTTLTPVLPGHEDELEAHLSGLDPLASPLSRLRRLHFSRLHVIRELVHQGRPQVPETLDAAYLVFTTSHDGPLESFLRDLAGLGPAADAIWGHCVGYPGVADPTRFAAWVTEHRKNNGYLVSPLPYEQVDEIKEALRVHRGFGELVDVAAGLDDEQLRVAFLALVVGHS